MLIQTRIEEGDKVMKEEAGSAKADTTKKIPMNKISTTDKMLQTREVERLEEGGGIMSDQADKTSLSSVGIEENSATMRQNVAKRRLSRPSQADNSSTTPTTPTTMIVAECCNDVQSEINVYLQPDQHLQLKKCMVCRLWHAQSHDVS